MGFDTTLGLAALALLFEAALGYPPIVLRLAGHPVIWMGSVIAQLDANLNHSDAPPERRRMAGVAALAILLAAVGIPAFLLEGVLLALPFGLLPAALAASSLLAQRSLHDHVARVADALDQGLDAGRAAVSHIVGRDPQALDETGVVRGAIESLAENFSDAIVAPTFWMMAGGLAGGALYKAINTADSMIGHKTRRHLDFGWASARLDDLVNLPASRLSGLLLIGAAVLMPGASPRAALRAIWQDARLHRSPNAGWPEAAMAGALGIAIAGPRAYHGVMTEYDFMNRGGRRELTAADIRRALQLYRLADMLLISLVSAAALAAAWLG